MRTAAWMRFSFALMVASLLLAACAEPKVVGGDAAAAWTWPDGDPQAGMQAFQDLRCYECHKVDKVPELAELHEGQGTGPVLGPPNARKARVDILIQIVAPGTDPRIAESHMRNFSSVMTVEQLTDLVAFVESLHG